MHPRVETTGEASQHETGNTIALRETLGKCLDKAKERGMTLCYENTDESVKDLVQLFEGLPELGLTLDVSHANLNTEENKSTATLESLGNRLRHVQLPR